MNYNAEKYKTPSGNLHSIPERYARVQDANVALSLVPELSLTNIDKILFYDDVATALTTADNVIVMSLGEAKEFLHKHNAVLHNFVYSALEDTHDEPEYVVFEFEYNGFMGKCNENVELPYTAKFKNWTDDPGITLCECSDGKERLLPTFTLKDFKAYKHPLRAITGTLFGKHCSGE